MNVLESQIEDMIVEMWNLDEGETMCERGLEICGGVLLRQYTIGNAGRIDLLHIAHDSYDDVLFVTLSIVEIKRTILTYNDLGQLCRYARHLRDAIDKIPHDDNIRYIVRGVLIGTGLDAGSDFVYLSSEMPYIEIYTATLDSINGLEFDLDSKKWSVKSYDAATVGKSLVESVSKVING